MAKKNERLKPMAQGSTYMFETLWNEDELSGEAKTRRSWQLFCLLPSVKAHGCIDERPSFEALCADQSFDAIAFALKDTRIDNVAWLCAATRDPPLHVLLRHKPPLRVVSAVCRTLKECSRNSVPECVRDVAELTALHVACRYGCSMAVTARIMNGAIVSNTLGKKHPAALRDVEGRLPIHWACTVANDSSAQVVAFLVQAFPESVYKADQTGRTPLQIAVQHGASPATIEILHLARAAKQQHIADPRPVSTIHCSRYWTSRNEDDDMSDADDVSSIGSTGASVVAQKSARICHTQHAVGEKSFSSKREERIRLSMFEGEGSAHLTKVAQSSSDNSTSANEEWDEEPSLQRHMDRKSYYKRLAKSEGNKPLFLADRRNRSMAAKPLFSHQDSHSHSAWTETETTVSSDTGHGNGTNKIFQVSLTSSGRAKEPPEKRAQLYLATNNLNGHSNLLGGDCFFL